MEIKNWVLTLNFDVYQFVVHCVLSLKIPALLLIMLFYFFRKVINLDQNDAAMSIALCKFPHMDPTSTFCLVGVAKDYQLSPRSVGGGSIHVYR